MTEKDFQEDESPPGPEDVTVHQRTTRRRGQALVDAIFAAVRAEIAEVGYAHITIESIAVRASTSKAVIYRRWTSRAELVAAALINDFVEREVPPDTGGLRGDLIDLLRLARRRTTEIGMHTIWGMLTESQHNADLANVVHLELIASSRQRMMTVILDRAAARGELDASRLTPRRSTLALDQLGWEMLTRGNANDQAIEAIIDDIFLPLVCPGPEGATGNSPTEQL